MKKVIIATALLFVVVLNYAQSQRIVPQPNSPEAAKAETEAKAKKAVDKLSGQLSLSKDQQTKLYNLTISFYTEKQNLSNTKAADPAGYKAKMKTTAEKYIKQMNAFLTPQQQQAFDTLVKEHNKEAADAEKK